MVASVDPAQCNNRVAHIMTMTSRTLQAYKVRQRSVMGMLQPIQSMEYYPQMGFIKSSHTRAGKTTKNKGSAKVMQRHHQREKCSYPSWPMLNISTITGSTTYAR